MKPEDLFAPDQIAYLNAFQAKCRAQRGLEKANRTYSQADKALGAIRIDRMKLIGSKVRTARISQNINVLTVNSFVSNKEIPGLFNNFSVIAIEDGNYCVEIVAKALPILAECLNVPVDYFITGQLPQEQSCAANKIAELEKQIQVLQAEKQQLEQKLKEYQR